MKIKYFSLFLLMAVFFLFTSMPLHAGDRAGLSDGQTIYVPAYSHTYYGSNESSFPLTVILSIRNIDPKQSITITGVHYYESEGILVKKFVDQPVTLKPLASLRYIIPEKDKRGGSGANFIVKWSSTTRVNPPIVESIMIGAGMQQGISFTSRGQVIIPPK